MILQFIVWEETVVIEADPSERLQNVTNRVIPQLSERWHRFVSWDTQSAQGILYEPARDLAGSGIQDGQRLFFSPRPKEN